jgi:cellulose synthase/poly-beta-1,6-N-acetylglucosamine synthase-like glycosyltransferase
VQFKTGSPTRFGSSSEEVLLDWNKWIRQIHRWLSMVFTATVVANFVAMGLGEPPAWIVYSPLLPLFLLLLTGLYLFVLPYATNWHSEQRTGG